MVFKLESWHGNWQRTNNLNCCYKFDVSPSVCSSVLVIRGHIRYRYLSNHNVHVSNGDDWVFVSDLENRCTLDHNLECYFY